MTTLNTLHHLNIHRCPEGQRLNDEIDAALNCDLPLEERREHTYHFLKAYFTHKHGLVKSNGGKPIPACAECKFEVQS